jgi:hypothetical protein
MKKSRIQYCIDNPKDVFLQGTRDSDVKKESNAYLIYETFRCTEKTKQPGDPPCKPKQVMKLRDGTSTEGVAIEKLIEDGADLTLYEEDLKADSIDNFIRYKKIAMKIFNQKIDFTTFDDYAVRYNEVWTPTITMTSPSYTDSGYRFRYNNFDRDDKYFVPHSLENVFFDYFKYNTDTY